jgi:hypothetical protein
MLTEHWAAEERVAQALMSRPVLYADDLDKLIAAQGDKRTR